MTLTLRIGDLVRGPAGRGRAVVYGVKLDGGGRLLALLYECRPRGARYGLRKRGPFSVDVVGRDIETAAQAWWFIATEAVATGRRARRPVAKEVWRRVAIRARRNEARLRALAERSA